MINLQLIIGYLGNTPRLPHYDLFGKSISEHFFDASDKDINLKLDLTRIDWTKRYPENTESYYLHTALNDLLYKIKQGSGIGLIFARSYKSRPNALGVMFDRGFKTQDDPYGADSDFSAPRLGCAVFLDRIDKIYSRTSNANEYVSESIYTTIHELGHVFNLVHNTSEPNFMKGGAPKPLEDEDQFSDGDCSMLGTCSWNDLIAPGGSPFRDRTGATSTFSNLSGIKNRSIAFEISTARNSIYRFEPLELDIQIQSSLEKNESVTIPDEIDPGYSSFKIWIEHPSGERRLYRSPRHYCSSGNTFTLSKGEKFERDISIFGQSGGYTFEESGEYSIWISFQIGDGEKIHSNVLKLEVLPINKQSKDLLFLTIPGIARLFYYRFSPSRSKYLKLLCDYREENESNKNNGVIDYTLGRIYAKYADTCKSRSAKNRHATQSLLYLRRAIDNKLLGYHARHVAKEVIDKL